MERMRLVQSGAMWEMGAAYFPHKMRQQIWKDSVWLLCQITMR